MDELERQLRDFAAHRAAQVPAFDATSLTADAGKRRPPLPAVLAIAALVVALLVGGGYLLFGSDSEDAQVSAPPATSQVPNSTSVPALTTPPTTTGPPASRCPEVSGTGTDAVAGGSSMAGGPFALHQVYVQAGECLDRVTFAVQGVAWSVRYEDGPFALEPSGERVAVDGTAFLVVRIENAGTGGALAGGRDNFVPVDPSVVEGVRMVEDFEGRVTWIIGLESRLPFKMVPNSSESNLSIDIPAQQPRDQTCTNAAGHFQVRAPEGWFVRVGPAPCSLFAAEPFTVDLDSNWHLISAGVRLERLPEGVSMFETIINRRELMIDGRRAVVIETVGGPNSFRVPTGDHGYYVEIEWGAVGVFGVSGIGGPGGGIDDVKAKVDEIANSARFVP